MNGGWIKDILSSSQTGMDYVTKQSTVVEISTDEEEGGEE